MDYLMEAQAFEYQMSKAQNQIELESYINECVILAENSNLISKLKAFNEAEGKSGWEKIKDGLKKFGEFIKRIFTKFFDKMSRFFKGNKAWLDKHKATIINNPFKFESVTMYDYFEGIKRITGSYIPAFTNYDTDLKDKLIDDKTTYEWMAKCIKMDKFTYSDGVNFGEAVTNFFRGGENMKTFTPSTLNMSDIFNYCYEYDKMAANIEHDQKTLRNALDGIQSAIDKKAKTLTADQAKEPTVDTTGEEKHENVLFSNVYGIIVEDKEGAIKIGNPTSNDNNTSGTQLKGNNTPGTVGDKDKTAASNSDNNVDYNSRSATEVKNKTIEDVNNTNDAKAISEMSDACARYRQASMAVFTSKCTVAEKCYKDFLKILIAHVDSYAAKKTLNNKQSDAATDYKTNNVKPNDGNPHPVNT